MFILCTTTVEIKNNKEAVPAGNVVKKEANGTSECFDSSGDVEKEEVRMEQAAENFFPCEFVVKEEIEKNFENNEEAGPSGIVVEKDIETAESTERMFPLGIVVKEELETDEVEDSNLIDNEHLEENDEKFYQCGACMATFAKYDDLKDHVKKVRKEKNNTTHPPILTSFICFKCKKTFASPNFLRQHMITHTGEKTHECPQCSKRFFRKGCLKVHMKRHLDVKPFRCEVCRKRFIRKAECMLHMRTHTGEKPHECHICHLCFSQPSALRRHVLTHVDGMNFKCELCPGEKLFKTKVVLTKHMRIHNCEKIHKCFKCDMKFLIKSNRTVHERTHLGIKPFECEYCQKRFTHSGTLTTHIRTHTGEKPYKCELCGKGFSRLHDAKAHMKREKNKEIEKRCDFKNMSNK